MANDTIEREIFIKAGIEHVWSLVSRVGFWVGDELHFDREAAEGELVVIDTENYGDYPVRVDRLDAPRYAAYRWASAFPGQAPDDTNSTLVEFSLTEQDGGVLLRFKESGFNGLVGGGEVRQRTYDESIQGWDYQFARLVEVAEGAGAG